MGKVARPKSQITDGELEILRVVWSLKQCGLREVHDELKKVRSTIAESTVANRLTRMEEKKLIRSIDNRRPKQYEAMVEQSLTADVLLDDVRKRVFGGSAGRMALRLLESIKLTPAERKAVRDHLDKMK